MCHSLLDSAWENLQVLKADKPNYPKAQTANITSMGLGHIGECQEQEKRSDGKSQGHVIWFRKQTFKNSFIYSLIISPHKTRIICQMFNMWHNHRKVPFCMEHMLALKDWLLGPTVTVSQADWDKLVGWGRVTRFFKSFLWGLRLGSIDPVPQQCTISKANRAQELYNMATHLVVL